MKKVLLINLPSPFLYEPAMNPPIGLCSIGTVCKQAGHDVRIVDFAVIDEWYCENPKSPWLGYVPVGADVVGISCVSAQFKYLRWLIRHIKSYVDWNPLIIVGGPHASSEPDSVLDLGVDIAFNGTQYPPD